VIDALVEAGVALREEDGTVRLDDVVAERVSVAQLYGTSACPKTFVSGNVDMALWLMRHERHPHRSSR
jgi:hypothetical protein